MNTSGAVFTVLYPAGADSTFDWDYYIEKHIPMVRSLVADIGPVQLTVDKGLVGPDGQSAAEYAAVVRVVFDSIESLQKALAEAAPQLNQDIPNFTNVAPVAQVSTVVD